MNILIIGPPGSGKGTQGRNIANSNQFITVTTGDMLRAESESGSDIGNDIKEIIDTGNLISDEMMNDIIGTHLHNLEIPDDYGLLFDGYPRTIEQAEHLDTLVTIDKVFLLNVNDDITIQRILKRGRTSNREDDKDIDVIKSRIEIYNTDTFPLKEFYEEQGKLVVVDGNQSIKDVYNNIIDSL